MSVTVKVPTQLRSITGGAAEISGNGGRLTEVIDDLEGRYPGLRKKLLDETGQLRRFVNIYLGEEDVRFLGGLSTEIDDGKTLAIIPAVAGGAM